MIVAESMQILLSLQQIVRKRKYINFDGAKRCIHSTVRYEIIQQELIPKSKQDICARLKDENHRHLDNAGDGRSTRGAAFTDSKSSSGGGLQFCSHSSKSGHEASSCFQLVAFPEWWGEKSKATDGGTAFGNTGRGRGGHSNRDRRSGHVTMPDELVHSSMALPLKYMKEAMAAAPAVDKCGRQILAFLVYHKNNGILC